MGLSPAGTPNPTVGISLQPRGMEQPGAATGEGSDLENFFCQSLVISSANPIVLRNRACLREGLVWRSVLLGQCLGGFELKIPHQRGQRTALKASEYDPGLKQ